MREHAVEYALIHLRGLATLVLNPAATDLVRLLGEHERQPDDGEPGAGPLAAAVAMLRAAPRAFIANLALAGVLAALYAACLIGGASRLRHPSWQLAVVGLTIAYLLAVSGGPAAVVRLRHPIMPLLCAVAGLGAARLLAWVQRRRGRAAVAAMASLSHAA